MVCSASPAAPGIPALGGGVIRQSMYRFPIFTAVLTGQKVRWFGAGIQRAVRVAERPDLSEASVNGSGSSVQPIIFAKLGSLAAQSTIFPFVRRVTFQLVPPSSRHQIPAPCQSPPPPGPKGAGVRVSNHVIDWPAITVRTLYGPTVAVIAARNQKRALGCADQKGHLQPIPASSRVPRVLETNWAGVVARSR